jgi:hypothetical protein
MTIHINGAYIREPLFIPFVPDEDELETLRRENEYLRKLLDQANKDIDKLLEQISKQHNDSV